MIDFDAPTLGGCPGDLGQSGGGCLQFGPAGLDSGDQFAIEPAFLVLPAVVLDRACPLLGQTPAVAPRDCQRSRQGVGPAQQPRHHPHPVT
jgi:hypothetical protein